MKLHRLLAGLAIAAIVPIFASAQSYDSNQNAKQVSPAIPESNAVLSTACSTPLTPTSCASTSYQIYQFGAQGVGSYSFQFPAALNGGTFQFEASNDCTNFIATSLAQAGTTPITTTSTVTATGIYTGIGAARACIAIVATVAPSAPVTIVPFASQKIGDVGILNAAALTVANPTAFPTFPSTLTLSGIPAPQYAPSPAPTLVPIGTVSTSTTQYTYSFLYLGAMSAECDIENMDGTAVISPEIAFDVANANEYPEEAEQISVTPPVYGTTIQQSGQYVFDVRGAQWLDLPITTAGANQNATIQCVPRYSEGVPFSLDGAANLNVDIKSPLVGGVIPVTTPAPAPTVTPGWIATTKGCPTSPITINGVVSCVSSPNGYAFVNSIGLRDSSNTGAPDTGGIFPDDPANTACNNASNQGIGYPCNSTFTATTALQTVTTGVSGKLIHLMGLQVTNASSTGTLLTIFSGTGVLCVTNQSVLWGPHYVPPGGGFMLPVGIVPYATTLATGYGMCAATATAVTSVYLTAQVAVF